MLETDVWLIIEDVIRLLFDSYAPAMDRAGDEIGLQSIGWQGWLLPALIFEPDAISTDRLRVRAAYNAPGVLAERLVNAARLGFLVRVVEGEYRLTKAGHRAVQHILEAADATMASLRPMPVNDLERLAALLLRIVEASLAAPEPPGKWCIEHSRRTDRGHDTPFLACIDQYLGDLNAYRDDAHLAAWQPHGFNGSTWETFTILWRGDAASLDEVCHKMERRGHARSVYAEAVQDLIERGLIEDKDGKYPLTSHGSIFRQEIEDTTDRYFYAPWACLCEDETGELRTLLVQLRDGLHQLHS